MSKMFLSFLLILSFAYPLLAQEVDTAWVRRYNGPGNLEDVASSLVLDHSGNIYVTGWSYSNGTQKDYATVKYDQDGNEIWVKRYNGTGNSNDSAIAIDVDGSGNVYVTGSSFGSESDYDYLTIKYYPDGDTAWIRRYNGARNLWDHANAMGVDSSGNVYVTGSSVVGTLDYATIKYYSNGDTAWLRRFNLSGIAACWANAIDIDGSGNVYVTGHTRDFDLIGGEQFEDFATIKYYANGDTAWIRLYSGAGNFYDDARDITVDDVGNVYVTGFSEGPYPENADCITIKYYPNGDTAWTRRFNGGSYYDDFANAIVIDDYENVYVTGQTDIQGASSYLTIKYYPNGDTAWVRSYLGSAIPNLALALVVDDLGNVYVTGKSGGSGTSNDYATIKYNKLGTQLWSKRYYGETIFNDYASDIAIDGSGNVYVTGTSIGIGTSYDYATIKYVQFLRGDVDGDDSLGLSDMVYLINYLFKKGPAPYPIKAGDCNCDGKVSLIDIVYLIVYLFKGGPPPGC